ncbi:unnamed protein product [Mucor hiemalis]
MAFTKVPDCKLNSRFQERFDVAIEISGNLQSEEKNKLLEKEILSNLPSPQEEEQKRDPKERQNVCTLKRRNHIRRKKRVSPPRCSPTTSSSTSSLLGMHHSQATA